MKKKQRRTSTQRCLGFDSSAPRRQRTERIYKNNHEKSLPHLDVNYGDDLSNPKHTTQEKEHMVIDSTHTTQKASLLPPNSPASCTRGYAQLVDGMKKSCSDPSSVTRVALWAKAHRKKDGNPINSKVAETLVRIEQIDKERTPSSTNVADDAISKVLGPDRGHIRGLGFGVTSSKLSTFSQRDNEYKKLEEKYKKMEEQMFEMRSMVSHLLKSQGQTSEQFSNATNEHIC